ncbi:MAG: hypothetical protein O9345_16260 [Burkholderiaceae bacterium]|nr:hypothetical protein [Burkholderiales bacterium]MCZ8339680.1 hypothetical protein [Burkholderiaceae bacterium]
MIRSVGTEILDGDRWLCVVISNFRATDAKLIASVGAEYLRADPERRLERGAIEHILGTYLALHEGKFFQHWLWAIIERVVAGDDVDAVMRDMGYVRDGGGEAGR